MQKFFHPDSLPLNKNKKTHNQTILGLFFLFFVFILPPDSGIPLPHQQFCLGCWLPSFWTYLSPAEPGGALECASDRHPRGFVQLLTQCYLGPV